MTEDKWRRCPDARPMFQFLRARARRRKLRLFACAMCRLSLHLVVGLDGESLLREAEAATDIGGDETTIRLPNEPLKRYAADHSINARGREAQRGEVEASHLLQACRDPVAPGSQTEWHAAWHNAMLASAPFTWTDAAPAAGGPADQVAALRDIFGNPFSEPDFAPSWRTGAVMLVARGMYDSRSLGAMPALGDALEVAGCDNVGLLDHCRQPARHVRGCWVLDLLLGRS